MTLSWLMKIRIVAVLCIGGVLIGFLGWPMVRPTDPFGAVLFGNIGWLNVLLLVGLVVLVGVMGYFIAWPFGDKIGILAVPFGLGIWAVRSGSMSDEVLTHQSLAERTAFFSSLKFEPFLWLAIVAAGFAGVYLAKKIAETLKKGQKPEVKGIGKSSKLNVFLYAAVAVVLSGVIGQFLMTGLGQNVNLFDPNFGLIVSQPTCGQIVFAVLVSFGVGGFVVKKFFNGSYIWPAISSCLVSVFAVVKYLNSKEFAHSIGNWPVSFFPNAVLSALPLQMVAFGCLGAVWGYWLAVRYEYWRHHEMA